MKSLKTCPFCGGNALLSHLSNEYNDSYSVSCTGELNGDCAGLEGTPFYDTAEDATEAWNTRRVVDNVLSESIESLKDEIERLKAVTGFNND